MAGNVGRALTGVVAAPETWIVCELSSFQLEDVHEFRPRVAVLINLEPDHLDRHGSFEAYRDAKLRIFAQQTAEDTAVVPRGFGSVGGRARRVETAADDPLPAEPGLPGAHNRENAAAATAAARAAGLPDEAIAEALRTFAGVAHRLELVAEIGGVRYVNDSKATNTAAARRALSAYDVPLHVILGGSRKGESFDELAAELRGQAYLIGETADELAEALDRAGVPYARCGDLPAAVARAAESARPGDVVLLSPACASYDQFQRLRASRRGVPQARAEPVRVKRRHARVEHPRPRHARARRLRDGDGVQRDLGLRGDRRRQPGLLPQAPGDLCGAGTRAARRRLALELPGASSPRAAPRARLAVPARRRPRGRHDRQRRQAVDHVRRGDLPAVRAREAGAVRLDGAPPLAARRSAHARRADEARSGCSRRSSARSSSPSPISAR